MKVWLSPGWCGSVDWVPDCKPKGCRLDSQSGHMPGLQARSPLGGLREATDQRLSHTLMFLSLSFSLSSPLSLNKSIKSKKINSDREAGLGLQRALQVLIVHVFGYCKNPHFIDEEAGKWSTMTAGWRTGWHRRPQQVGARVCALNHSVSSGCISQSTAPYPHAALCRHVYRRA